METTTETISHKKTSTEKRQSATDESVLRILEIRALIMERDEARLSGNYGKADTMREQLEKKYDIEIIDQKDGPSGWKFKNGDSNKLPPGTKIPEEFESLFSSKKKRKRDLDGKEPASMNSEGESNKKKKKEQNTSSTSTNKPPSSAVNAEQERNRAMLSAVAGSSSSNVRNVNGVLIEEIRGGVGRGAKSGDRLLMQYVGRLKKNNKVFDSSKKPFSFQLGRGEVIKGWDIGCSGMTVGEQRRLTIPPEKAYGKSGAPPTIPPNSTLVFDITLVGLR